ncbi:hypothetical protein BKM15_26185 [Pseudomonas syringae pv. syringae]|nr:hypothetical protein BKM15_26185 [Pseudomonas syringae pv. syringae]
MKNIMNQLQKPFLPEDIEWRVQRAMTTTRGNKAVVLAYVTNRAIMNRLDEVFGVGGWKNEFREWRDKGVLCGLSVKINGEWITKWDGAEETNIEAVKGGFSGSMKRTAVQWGIGRYLYNLEETWVDVKEKGQNYINDKKANVKGYWDTPELPAWALPKLTVEDVIKEWIDVGGTESQFDDLIKKNWSIQRDQLKQNHLAGIVQLLNKRKAS